MVGNLSSVTAASARTAAPSVPETKSDRPSTAVVVELGKLEPASGKELPAAVKIEQIDLSEVAERLNQLMRSNQRNLRVQFDESSGYTVITVLNVETNEIVRQIPSDEVLALARRLDELGLLIDAEV